MMAFQTITPLVPALRKGFMFFWFRHRRLTAG
jgi:hypothetical protein